MYIRWNYPPQSSELAEAIMVRFQRVMPIVVDGVRNSSGWTHQGRLVRAQLRAWMARVRCLARETGEKGVVDSVEVVLLHLRGECRIIFKQTEKIGAPQFLEALRSALRYQAGPRPALEPVLSAEATTCSEQNNRPL